MYIPKRYLSSGPPGFNCLRFCLRPSYNPSMNNDTIIQSIHKQLYILSRNNDTIIQFICKQLYDLSTNNDTIHP